MSDDQPLSQEDIDAALAGLSGGGDESTEPETNAAAPESDGNAASEGGATVEDTNAANEAASAAPAETGPDAGGDAVGQDDIDALLNDMEQLAGSEASSTDAPPGTGDTSATDSPPDVAAGEQLDSAGRPFDEAAAEMAAAIAEEASAPPPPPPPPPAAPAPPPPAAPAPPPPGAEPMSLPDLDTSLAADEPFKSIELLKDVGLQVKIELGRSRMLVEDVLRLGEGSVVELDKLAGDPVDVYVNDRLVARGEVLVLNDNFCVRVNEIVSEVWKEFQTA